MNKTLTPANLTVCEKRLEQDLGIVNGFLDTMVNPTFEAAKASIHLDLDPFNPEGQKWIKNFRSAIEAYTVAAGEHGGVVVGDMYLVGQGPLQMDAADSVFGAFPRMTGVTVGVVFVLLGLAFRSFVVPLRALFCLSIMVGISFGLADLTFQHGLLNWLGIDCLKQDSTKDPSLFWMTPVVSFSVLLGLGLDYDVFLMESIAEARRGGMSDCEATVSGLCQTGNIISVAGVVMVIAFSAILFSQTPTLNQIAFVLVVGILIACFVTTKLIIPSAMGLLGGANFWPKAYPEDPSKSLVDVNDARNGYTSRVPVGWQIFCCCCSRSQRNRRRQLSS